MDCGQHRLREVVLEAAGNHEHKWINWRLRDVVVDQGDSQDTAQADWRSCDHDSIKLAHRSATNTDIDNAVRFQIGYVRILYKLGWSGEVARA